jgi:hypothetical protein
LRYWERRLAENVTGSPAAARAMSEVMRAPSPAAPAVDVWALTRIALPGSVDSERPMTALPVTVLANEAAAAAHTVVTRTVRATAVNASR